MWPKTVRVIRSSNVDNNAGRNVRSVRNILQRARRKVAGRTTVVVVARNPAVRVRQPNRSVGIVKAVTNIVPSPVHKAISAVLARVKSGW